MARSGPAGDRLDNGESLAHGGRGAVGVDVTEGLLFDGRADEERRRGLEPDEGDLVWEREGGVTEGAARDAASRSWSDLVGVADRGSGRDGSEARDATDMGRCIVLSGWVSASTGSTKCGRGDDPTLTSLPTGLGGGRWSFCGGRGRTSSSATTGKRWCLL